MKDFFTTHAFKRLCGCDCPFIAQELDQHFKKFKTKNIQMGSSGHILDPVSVIPIRV